MRVYLRFQSELLCIILKHVRARHSNFTGNKRSALTICSDWNVLRFLHSASCSVLFSSCLAWNCKETAICKPPVSPRWETYSARKSTENKMKNRRFGEVCFRRNFEVKDIFFHLTMLLFVFLREDLFNNSFSVPDRFLRRILKKIS